MEYDAANFLVFKSIQQRSSQNKRKVFLLSVEDYYRCKKQNFKKTNATKFLYSCTGYGGRCNNCKHHEIDDNRDKQNKNFVKFIKKAFEHKDGKGV